MPEQHSIAPRDEELRWLLALTHTPGLGPILIANLLRRFGSATAAANAPAAELAGLRGIGRERAKALADARSASLDLARTEIDRAQARSIRFVMRSDPDYPELLRPLPDAPPLLYVRGMFDTAGADRYALAVVGSRACTHYGMEQAGRFASVLASSGITIVSGGARGIDTAAHRAALRAGGRTVVVQGCGLAHTYPPENQALFDEIVNNGRGVVMSELPLDTPPKSENFPARNRIVSGMSLGVLVVEADQRSGALITARLAAEDHGREVMAIPGRVDSSASRGCLELIKSGGAALVTEPGDVIALIETPARHHHDGTHASRYAPAEQQPLSPLGDTPDDAPINDAQIKATQDVGANSTPTNDGASLDPASRAVWSALAEPMTLDQLAQVVGMEPGTLRGTLTMLEIQGRVHRDGPRFERSSK